MSNMKKLFFYVGNGLIGVISYYIYLILWVSFSWGEEFSLLTLESLLSLFISGIVFLGFNYVMLRKEGNSSRYWLIAGGIVIITIIIFVSIIGFS
ncbi:hypothetical protein [Bacillus sp. AK031]